jgi:acetyl esterase/lipase
VTAAACGAARRVGIRLAVASATAILLILLAPPPDGAAQPEVLRGVEYVPGGSSQQIMDVYIPEGDGPFPGVVVIHGGGWTSGDTTNLAEESKLLAEEGFVAFAVDYRKAPAFTFPAQVEDMEATVRFIREHAEEFKVNPRHLGALGGSAGGQLAALLGVEGEGPTDEGSRVNVVVSWSGPMDFTEPPAARAASGQDRGVGRGPVRRYIGCTPLICPQTYVEASPVTHVDPTDAPMFLANGTAESVALSQAQSMFDALQEADVPAELVAIQGRFHSVAYESKKPASLDGQTVFGASIAWLDEYIDRPPAMETPPGPPTVAAPPTEPEGDRFLLFAAIGAIVVVTVIALAAPRMRRRRH